MISLQRVDGPRQRRAFYAIGKQVYRSNPLHRSTEDDVMRMLVNGRSVFLEHADLAPFLIRDGRQVVGRFALIQDRKLPGHVQVSFFEALPDLEGVLPAIQLEAQTLHPGCDRLVVGLNGHLNYGAGLLASCFDEAPLFGMPYTPAYYLDYFQGLQTRAMASYRFDSSHFFQLRRMLDPTFDPGEITIRTLDRTQFARDVDIYTTLNNACFQKHPYWADRTTAEDFELFHPFRFLLRDEHFIVAEHRGRAVGFLLWYPDFNELLATDGELGLRHVLRYRLREPIQTARLTEIAVLPEYRAKRVDLAMILRMIQSVEEAGYRYTEGGFIFEENRGSIALTLRYIRRATGHTPVPHRRYCVFEGPLHEARPRPIPRPVPRSPVPEDEIRAVPGAAALSPGWDGLADSVLQRRPFLEHMERTNPCQQRYYELWRGDTLAGGAIVYRIDLDLLTYARLPSPLKMTVVGVPCSQSSPGLLGDHSAVVQLAEHLTRVERGLVIGLNLARPLDLPGVLDGRTLPVVVLRRRFETWDDYRAALRSSYRRRLRKQERAWAGVRARRGSCDRFDREMYDQYLAVFHRSDAKLERLSHASLRDLPGDFTLTTYRLDQRLVGWHIGLSEGDVYRFFMVGMDYGCGERLKTHGNILANALREAITDGAAVVDLGQTAETSKTRLGGRCEERHLFGYHRTKIVRGLLERSRRFLEYGTRVPETHVFREDP